MHRVAAASISMSPGTSYRSAAGMTAALRQKPIAAARGTTRLPCFRLVTCSPHAHQLFQLAATKPAATLVLTGGHRSCLWTNNPFVVLQTCTLRPLVSFLSHIGSLHASCGHPSTAELALWDMQPGCCTSCNSIQDGTSRQRRQPPTPKFETGQQKLVLNSIDLLACMYMLMISVLTHIAACLHNSCNTLVAGHPRQLGLDGVLPLHHVDVAGVDGALQRRYAACCKRPHLVMVKPVMLPFS